MTHTKWKDSNGIKGWDPWSAKIEKGGQIREFVYVFGLLYIISLMLQTLELP